MTDDFQISQATIGAFYTVVATSVARLAQSPGRSPEVDLPRFVLALQSQQQAVLEQVHLLTLEDEAELDRLLEGLLESVQIVLSRVTPSTPSSEGD